MTDRQTDKPSDGLKNIIPFFKGIKMAADSRNVRGGQSRTGPTEQHFVSAISNYLLDVCLMKMTKSIV